MITDKEAALLRRFMADDIVSDRGWRDKAASTWADSLCETRADAALLGHLMRKGIMWNNGEAVGLTDAGRAECEKLLAPRS